MRTPAVLRHNQGVLKFKRVLHQGMRGRDVSAVKIALGHAGFGRGYIALHTRNFGPAMRTNLKHFQKHVGLKTDGIYGPTTHAKLTPHFSAYARWLYNRQKVTAPSAYVNPFHASTDLEVGRVDMGVDYHGRGAISAIGDAEIVGFAGAGWPDGEYVLYKLLNGPHAGRYV
jgi:peptidoglycan hydrolase-like protein with peptidoglycan-binding domain